MASLTTQMPMRTPSSSHMPSQTIWDNYIWVDTLKDLGSPDSSRSSEPIEVVAPLPVKM